MAIIGSVVIAIVMACALAGAIAACFRDDRGLGKEFLSGLHAIGYIFIPVAGIMASLPYLQVVVHVVFGQAFAAIGADDAMAATSFLAVDMGGYHLAHQLADTREAWILAMMAGFMAGATIVFSIPVGLAMLQKEDHKYMALGVMSGLLSIPIGVALASLLLILLGPDVRIEPSTEINAATAPLALDPGTVAVNLTPLVVLVSALALGLWVFPDGMIRGFMAFGRGLDVVLKLVLVFSIIEYFTKVFSKHLWGWGFDPIIAVEDQAGPLRALEIAGYIGIMLAGAFPMVYLLQTYLAGPIGRLGRRVGLGPAGAAGLLAAVANILAMFRLVRDMRARDKVQVIAFAVCAAFLLGDHLSFTANFQPNLILAVLVGKLGGGACGFFLASKLSAPKALELERRDRVERVRAICAEIPVLKGRDLVITPLGGGLTNLNFKVIAGQDQYVLRIAGEGTDLLGIDRERELVTAQEAAKAGVGPKVIAHLPGHSALLTEFRAGVTLKPHHFDGPMLARTGTLLRRFHEHPAPAGVGAFCPFGTVRTYLELARARKAHLPPELPTALERMAAIEAELGAEEPACLCHNDLLAANFIDDGRDLTLIDWEYGGVGNRFFDLGNLAVNLQLTEDQERELLASYFGEVRPEDLRRLRLMRLMSDLREALWSFLQSRISQVGEPEEYYRRGCEHLERFLSVSQREMALSQKVTAS